MDVLQTYAAFVRACESGSFSAVARDLGTSQSSISKQIAALESELGVQLFARTTRRLTPTSEAMRLYEHVRQMLDAVEEMRANKDRKPVASGLLRIAMPTSFGRRRISPLVSKYLSQHPLVQLDLVLTDQPLDLVEEGIELEIRVGTLASSTLMARPIGIAEQLLVATPEYLARAGMPDSPSDLAHHSCILYSGTARPNRWEFESEHGRHAVELPGLVRVNDPDAMYEMVLAGLGIALVPDWVIGRDTEEGRVRWLLQDYYPTPQPVNFVYPQTRFLSSRARSFIEFTLSELRSTR